MVADTWMGRSRRALKDPVFYAGLTQTTKAAAAAALAWVLAVRIGGTGQAFLAPWAAVLTVHATIYRSFSEGLRQVVATVLGVVVAFVFGDLWGLDALTLGLAVLVALLLGRHPRLGTAGVTVATTAIVVLTTGTGDNSASLATRLLDTAIGIVVGGVVNFLVWPPLRDRAAARAVDAVDRRLGELLSDMATRIRSGHTTDDGTAWIDRTNELDQRIDDAWALVRQAGESTRFNLRRPRSSGGGDLTMSEALRRGEQAVAETRSMARSLQRHATASATWSATFSEPWVNILEDAGEALGREDGHGLNALIWRIDDLALDLQSHASQEGSWPLYGALLTNLRNIVEALDRVAAAHPIVAPRHRVLPQSAPANRA